MSQPAFKLDFITPEEYLAGEKHAEIRHEYVDGQVYAMAGESKAHNIISLNIASFLRNHLRGSPCRVYMENVKTAVSTLKTKQYRYPDVQVSCGGAGNDAYYETAPKLIVEVLSDSTAQVDRTDKFYAYRNLPSLEEYVLVAQDMRQVEVYRRNTQWNREVYDAESAAIRLDSLKITLDFAIIYEDVEIP